MSSTSIPTENPIILNIMPTYGALLVGAFLSQAIWGISTIQVFLYFHSFGHDSPSVKLLVIALWLIDTVDQILIMKTVFPVLILEYGRVAGLLVDRIETTIHTLLTAVVVFIVQMYFIRRIFLFGKKYLWIKVLSVVLTFLSTWQLVGPIVYWAGALNKPLAEQGRPFYVNINISLRAAAFIVDVTVAACMIWLLTQAQGSILSQTQKLLFRILIVTINSGTWTALVALVVLILAKIYPADLYFTIPEFPMCSLYFSTLLANLNSRKYVRGEQRFPAALGSDETNRSGRSPALVLRSVQLREGRSSRSGENAAAEDSPTIPFAQATKLHVEPEYGGIFS